MGGMEEESFGVELPREGEEGAAADKFRGRYGFPGGAIGGCAGVVGMPGVLDPGTPAEAAEAAGGWRFGIEAGLDGFAGEGGERAEALAGGRPGIGGGVTEEVFTLGFGEETGAAGEGKIEGGGWGEEGDGFGGVLDGRFGTEEGREEDGVEGAGDFLESAGMQAGFRGGFAGDAL